MKNKNTYVLFITIVAALGGFLFGFDMAVVSGIIEPVKKQFGLSSSQEGIFVSCALLGCIAGVAFSGYLADKAGRKKVLFISALLFLISAFGFAFSTTYEMLIFFRVMAGMGVGVASNISPLYISEMAPAKKRGQLVTYYQLAITIGILIAYISNYFLQHHASSNANMENTSWNNIFIHEVWRGMFFIGVIPAVLFSILLFFVPESPRWLIQNGKRENALKILEQLNTTQLATETVNSIEKTVTQKNTGYNKLFKPPLKKLLIMAMMLTALSQFSGINGVIFYGPTIMQSAGIVTSDALFYQIILGAANMLFTIIAIAKVDSMGRRPLYLTGSICAALALTLTGVCFLFDIKGWIMLGCIIAFLLFFAFSLGPLKFVISTEIFPTHVRGTALSICIMTMWVSDWFVNLLFPIIRDGFGIAITFFIFSFFCFISFFYAKIYLPETKGKSLEDLEQQLMHYTGNRDNNIP